VREAQTEEKKGGHKNKEHFLNNGLSRAKSAMKHRKNDSEKVTWIIYNDKTSKAGHNSKMLEKYKAKASKLGINVMEVDNVDKIVDYVNNKTGNDSRSKDKITSFYYVGHATPGSLDVGYGGTGENFEPDDFTSEAFSSGCHVNLVGGCRTTIPGSMEDSNVTQFQEILDQKSNIYGNDVRVNYTGGVLTDKQLLKTNNGKIVSRKGLLPVKK
jgi:hypothetical protein